jgi:hypothetical protein
MSATAELVPLEMNPAIRARWTAALRSGEYRQGHCRLRDEDGAFCCMGVLCDLAARDGIVTPVLQADYGWYAYDSSADFLPSSVQEWAGLTDDSPRVMADDGEEFLERTLAELNDDLCWTFAQIADAIDGKQPEVTG